VLGLRQDDGARPHVVDGLSMRLDRREGFAYAQSPMKIKSPLTQPMAVGLVLLGYGGAALLGSLSIEFIAHLEKISDLRVSQMARAMIGTSAGLSLVSILRVMASKWWAVSSEVLGSSTQNPFPLVSAAIGWLSGSFICSLALILLALVTDFITPPMVGLMTLCAAGLGLIHGLIKARIAPASEARRAEEPAITPISILFAGIFLSTIVGGPIAAMTATALSLPLVYWQVSGP